MKRVCLRERGKRVWRRRFCFPQGTRGRRESACCRRVAGEGDHAVHEVGLVEGAADVAFTGLVGGHAAIGEDEAGRALRGEVADDELV